ncbi:hypothetical protein DFP72DRAFT_532699 [Ephemerocybe angulata]|uniref:Uncharacterized protein n=1 Tax=Ephemerocybe angulata TaxID=980116 RepID=A0A8H6HPC4_9AGAR|nr:hypothetical protein DFP72DRAFT_532699 [Tulosesus angulatus]
MPLRRDIGMATKSVSPSSPRSIFPSRIGFSASCGSSAAQTHDTRLAHTPLAGSSRVSPSSRPEAHIRKPPSPSVDVEAMFQSSLARFKSSRTTFSMDDSPTSPKSRPPSAETPAPPIGRTTAALQQHRNIFRQVTPTEEEEMQEERQVEHILLAPSPKQSHGQKASKRSIFNQLFIVVALIWAWAKATYVRFCNYIFTPTRTTRSKRNDSPLSWGMSYPVWLSFGGFRARPIPPRIPGMENYANAPRPLPRSGKIPRIYKMDHNETSTRIIPGIFHATRKNGNSSILRATSPTSGSIRKSVILSMKLASQGLAQICQSALATLYILVQGSLKAIYASWSLTVSASSATANALTSSLSSLRTQLTSWLTRPRPLYQTPTHIPSGPTFVTTTETSYAPTPNPTSRRRRNLIRTEMPPTESPALKALSAPPPRRHWKRKSLQSRGPQYIAGTDPATAASQNRRGSSPLPKIDIQFQVARRALSNGFGKLKSFFKYEGVGADEEAQRRMEEFYDNPVPDSVELKGKLFWQTQGKSNQQQPGIVTHRMYWQGETSQVPEVLSAAMSTMVTHLTITHCHILLEDVIAIISSSPFLERLEVSQVVSVETGVAPAFPLQQAQGQAVSHAWNLTSLSLASTTQLDRLFRHVQLQAISHLALRLVGEANKTNLSSLVPCLTPASRGQEQVVRVRGDLLPAKRDMLGGMFQEAGIIADFAHLLSRIPQRQQPNIVDRVVSSQ